MREMSLPMLTCPLCCRPGFNSAFSLWSALAESPTRQLCCPICNVIIAGLDEFAKHLSEHKINCETTLSTSQTPQFEPAGQAPLGNEQPTARTTGEPAPSEPRFESCRELLANGDFTVPPEINSGVEDDASPVPVCHNCGARFPNQAILAVHVQVLHRNQKGSCTDKAILNEGGNGRRRILTCDQCPRTFSLKSSLKVHLKVSHPTQVDIQDSPKKEGEKFDCKTCGKSFNKESSLAQHNKTHDDKSWQCTICSKNFSTKYFLRKHKRIHTGETPYECTTCHKVFTFQQSYHKHMLYHTDDKPYCCSSCGRLFKELSTLTNHERIHTGEKPFVCENCGKSFRQRVSYLVHRRIHTGDMPYKCTACHKSFRYKISQKTHKCPEHPPGIVVRTSSPSGKPNFDASTTPHEPVNDIKALASRTGVTDSFDINQFLQEWTSLELNKESANERSVPPSDSMGRLSISWPSSMSTPRSDTASDDGGSTTLVRGSQLSLEDTIREDAISEFFSVAD